MGFENWKEAFLWLLGIVSSVTLWFVKRLGERGLAQFEKMQKDLDEIKKRLEIEDAVDRRSGKDRRQRMDDRRKK